MKTCTIVLGLAQDLSLCEGDLIGADRGALVCARQQRRMVLAIGDFDSVTPPELALIRRYADQIRVLPVMKDETDALSALRWAEEQGYQSVVMTGGLGGRQDHQMANLLLMMYRKTSLILREKDNELTCLDPGRYVFHPGRFRFVSFFAVEPSVMTLSGFLYPLEQYTMECGDTIGVSNEIVGKEAVLTLQKGRVMVIRCNDG